MDASVKDLLDKIADFDTTVVGYFEILKWAEDDEGGGLPSPSARPFAAWLDGVWNDHDDGEGKLTNKDILEGAWEFWTGRS